MDNAKKNPLDLDDDKIRAIERKMSQSSNVSELQSGALESVNISFPKEMNLPAGTFGDEKQALPEISTPKPPSAIKNLRTYQGDVAEAIKNQNASVLTIALAEKKRQDNPVKQSAIEAKEPKLQVKAPKKPINPELKRNIVLSIVSIILIVSGVGAIYGFYVLQKNDVHLAETTVDKSIIGWNDKVTIDTTSIKRETLIQKINEYRENSQIENGEILYLAMEKKTAEETSAISTADLFKILDTKAPAPLQRSFRQNFMFGFFGLPETKEPFLLIELDSFDLAFSGMLNWERFINEDIGSIFTRRVIAVQEELETPSATSSSTAETSATTSPKIQTRILNFDNPNPEGFVDVTIRNKDARILKNLRGETILLYSFIDRRFLLITSSEAVLREILNKLIAEELIR